MFGSKVAFAVLLNFPLTTLADRIRDGAGYDRRTWAEVRLTGWFDTRIPGALAAQASAVEAAADQYIGDYNLWMHHVLGEDGARRFPAKKRLITHWNLRDELKANYAEKEGLVKQRTIARVMERIVTQTIPAVVVNNPHVDWDPVTNEVRRATVTDAEGQPPPAASGPRAATRPARANQTAYRPRKRNAAGGPQRAPSRACRCWRHRRSRRGG